MRPNRTPVLLLVLGGLSAALPAAADQSSEYPPSCDSSKVSRSDVERAHTVFLSGKQYLEESNYDKAIGYFKDAYAIDCSVHAILPIIATAFERKGDKGEAVRALAEYLDRAPSAPDHDVIERRIKNLKDQMARDQPPPAPPAPPPPAPPPAAPATAELVASGAVQSSSASPPAAADARPSALPWVTVGVGGAAVVTGVIIYVIGAGDVSAAEKTCGGDRAKCSVPSAIDQGNNGRKLEQIGGPLIGVGLAVAAAGLIWHILERPADKSAVAPAARVEVLPVVAYGYAGVGLRSAF
jgi:tetratricopeptide (TPR) repeat protein